MYRSVHHGLLLAMLAGGPFLFACQSPTDSDDTPDVDDFLEWTATPNPISAGESPDGRTYRIVRGNNQPDDIVPYDWKTSFSLTIRLNDLADDDDYLEFPVDVTSATVAVQQASGGVITPPTGSETVHSDYVVTRTTSNRYPGVNSSNTLEFDVWYDLPSLRREAVITVTLSFKDNDGITFTKTIDINVAP
jgi:hypothetical protein